MHVYLPIGTMENFKNLFHIWWCIGWDLNPGSTKYERVLTIREWFLVYQSLKIAVVPRQLQQVHKDIHTVIFHCSSVVPAQILCFCIQASWCHSRIMFLVGQEVVTVDVVSGHHHHLCCHFGNSVPIVHLPVCTAVFSIPYQYSSDFYPFWPQKSSDSMFLNNDSIQKQLISLHWMSCTKQNSCVMTCQDLTVSRHVVYTLCTYNHILEHSSFYGISIWHRKLASAKNLDPYFPPR
jgi:hypothetical protein